MTDTPEIPEGFTAHDGEKSWRCFHCGEVFTNRKCAAEHFGADETADAACLIKDGAEYHLVKYIRDLEAHLASYQNESDEITLAWLAKNADHQTSIRIEEEKGYGRGLRDGTMNDESDDKSFILYYSDAEMPYELFSGYGAKFAAHARFEQQRSAWTCTLLASIRYSPPDQMDIAATFDPTATETTHAARIAALEKALLTVCDIASKYLVEGGASWGRQSDRGDVAAARTLLGEKDG